MCSFGDLDPCEVWRETTRRARKSHECDACGAVIRPKDVYLVHFNVFEGEPESQKMCADCWLARAAFAEAHDGFLRPPSSLLETLQDCVGENDDKEDRWRPLLASVKRRYRVSAQRRKRMQAERGAP